MANGSTDARAVDLLGMGIEALAHADAAQLERLAKAAPGARRPGSAEERAEMRERLQTMGRLIALTLRNLRLLRGAGCGGYGPLVG